jgi:hypothetical protein
MMKCPFCQFDNEDGALFCEQCKTDLGADATVRPSLSPEEASAQTVPLGPTPPPVAALVLGEDHEADTVPEAQVASAAPASFLESTDVVFSEAPPVPVSSEPPPVRVDGQTWQEYTPPPVPVSSEPPPIAVPVAEATPLPPVPEVAVTQKADTPPPVATPATMNAPPQSMDGIRLPAGATPKLVVIRGQRLHQEYQIYEGINYIGRADEAPVDIDLEDQEPTDRIWSSRQHAKLYFEDGQLSIEDQHSTNGTFVNRTRVQPGQRRPLQVNDVIQIGTVQMKIKV